MDLETWLDEQDLTKYLAVFVEHEVTVGDLPELTEGDLAEMGLPIGPRRRALRAIAEIVAGEDDRAAAEPLGDPEVPVGGSAERRQMTVVFCDLVGSTSLSGRMDPEDLREVMRRYHETVTDHFAGHGGHVAKYLGDGVLVYFGWPQASEDQAARSVAAALRVVAAVEELDAGLPGGERLSARIGIATGAVVIGDLSGESDAIVGQTPNLAARLEGVASSGEVVVDESTARLVEHEFELNDAGPQALKGIDRPVGALRVLAPRSVATRFDAIHGQGPLEIFVGRKAELALLRQSWERAVSGEGHVVLVGGEAGIGKSRLIREFVDSIRGQHHELYRFQCSPAHVASMLHPFIDQIERRAGLRSAADDHERLDRVEAYVSGWAGDPDETIPLVAELLKVPLGDRYGEVRLSGEELKSRTLSVLVEQFLAEANDRPVIVVVEDLHWVDPTSLQLLRQLQSEVGSTQVLVVGSHRSDWSIDHLDPDLVSALVLGRLATADVRTLAAAMTGAGNSLSGTDEGLLSEVVERTDGIPLYVEEFTRAVMEGEGAAATPIPETLSASLMARLDRLGDAKYVAQVASVIGREFSGELLTDVIELSPEAVDAALERIIEAGLVRGRLVEEGTEYTFKHALVRDAAYESLLRQDRRAIHQCVADRLAEKSTAGGASAPEILALHQSEAENWEDSLANWREAGAHAIAAGATEEAIAHLTRALDALAHLDEGPDRSRSEMEILIDLAPVEMTLRGYASDRAKQLYDRAYELAREVGDENHRFITLWAGYYITEVRAQWNESRRNVDQLLDLDTSALLPDLPIQIDHAALTYSMSIGALDLGREHAQRIIDAYDPDLHDSHKHRFGAHDPCVCALNQLGVLQAQLGRPDLTREAVRESIRLSSTLDHPPTRGQSLWFSGMNLYRLGALDEARRMIDDAIAYCVEERVEVFLRTLEFFRFAAMEDRQEGYAGLTALVDPLRERNRHGMFVPTLAGLCAELAIEHGEAEHALMTVEYAQRAAEATGELIDLGAIHALRGRVMQMGGERDRSAAIAAFRHGLDRSAETGARFPELKNAVGLAEVYVEAGDPDKARRVLEPRYEWFEHGHELPLLRRARALLVDLG